MAKAAKTVFSCRECGAEASRWTGKCPSCGAWNTLVEEAAPLPVDAGKRRAGLSSERPRPLSQVRPNATPHQPTGIAEFDRLLAGGLVSGGAILVGGEPGIGKSTLLLQICGAVAKSDREVLYVTGEESAEQVKLRAARLGLSESPLLLASETDAEKIAAWIAQGKPALAVVDSIQTVHLAPLGAAAGSVAQVRESAATLVVAAKQAGTALILVGHVTKDGSIAGPKTLEHMVDTVLYFEGDRFQNHRILRSVKNRFGPTQEIGVFRMTPEGLLPVDDPSSLFVSQDAGTRIGTAVSPIVEGSRTLLVEIQALTTPARYGTPERRATGIDPNRLRMILAVLERRAGLHVGTEDVFVNVAGGLTVEEPAADLAVALAVASAFLEKGLPAGTVALGEIALTGEIRPAPMTPIRLKEAKRLGFSRAVIPGGMDSPTPGVETVRIGRIDGLPELLTELPRAAPRKART